MWFVTGESDQPACGRFHPAVPHLPCRRIDARMPQIQIFVAS
jgi:hypothetical protein